ncbi:hypothetical protein V8C35DRAFT_299876 [Trichoderma chlorosporum]
MYVRMPRWDGLIRWAALLLATASTRPVLRTTRGIGRPGMRRICPCAEPHVISRQRIWAKGHNLPCRGIMIGAQVRFRMDSCN